MKDFRHKTQDLWVFLGKLIQLRKVPRLLRRPRWAYAAGLRECIVGAGSEFHGVLLNSAACVKKEEAIPLRPRDCFAQSDRNFL